MARGSIRKLGGRYYVRTRIRVIDPETGKPAWKQVERAVGTDPATGKPASKRAAEAMLKTLQGEVDAGRFNPATTTVQELGQRWLREHVQRNLKPSTAANYKGTFYAHIAPTLGPRRIDEIDAKTIRHLLERRYEQGLGRETIAKIHRHAHAMFAFAVDEELLTVNPAAFKWKGERQRKKRGTALTLLEVERFLRACSPRWRLFFRVALSTGLRRGEMIGLRWGDVSLSEHVLYVRRSICPYDDISDDESLSTKTEAGERVVPLFPDALEALEDLYRLAGAPQDDAPVFGTVEPKPAINGRRASIPGGVLSPRLVTRAFRRYAERAGLPEHLTLHDLRHTTITRLVEQRADPLLVATIAGHAKPSITLDRYSHLQLHHAQDAAQRYDPSHRFPTDPARTSSDNVLSTARDEWETPANIESEQT